MSEVAERESEEVRNGYRLVRIGPKKLEIPKEWDMKKLDPQSGVTERVTDGSHHSPDHSEVGDYYYATVSNMSERGMNYESCGKIDEEAYIEMVEGDCKPRKGEVLFSKDGTVGLTSVFNDDEDVVLLSSIAMIDPVEEKLDPYFLSHFLDSRYTEDQIKSLKSGTAIRRVVLKDIKQFRVPLPPLPEQRRIAAVLSTVDEEIRQTEEIIETTEELSQGLLSDLISHGTNSAKPVERQIGPKTYNIAEGWELYDISELATDEHKSIRGGPSGTQLKNAEFADDGVKIYGQENVSNEDFARGNRYLDEKEFPDFESVEIMPSDVLVTMMGTVGDSTTFPESAEQGVMDSHLLRIRAKENLVFPKYLSLLIDESKIVSDQIHALSHGLVMSGLNIGIVESITVPIPLKEEQKRIVNILSEVDALHELEEKRLEKMRQLKRALMQDLLTGEVRTPESISLQ